MDFIYVLGISLLTFFSSYYMLRFFILISKKYNFVDKPDGKRKLQFEAISKVGGISIFFIFSSFTILYNFFNSQLLFNQILPIVAPLTLATFIGFWDDIKSINPWIRLILQSIIGIIAWILDVKINIFPSESFNFIIQIFWFLLLINGTNLIDNTDGLSASISTISLIFSLIISFYLNQNLVFILALILLSNSLSFLILNWNPAKVYLGDSGSYLLGTSIALVLIKLRPENLEPIYAIMVLFLLAFIPIIDTFFVVFNRLRKGIHPFTAGRDHLSHLLQKKGLSIKKSVSILIGIQFFTGLIGSFLVYSNIT